MDVTSLGAILGLTVAIVLILKKVPPAYGLIAGALIGGIAGGADVSSTVALMIGGAKNIIPAVLRILTAGILAGVLIETGGAARIAETIVKKIGEARAFIALIIAAFILTAVGVFIDVAVITVSPIALAIAKRAGISKMSVLIAMIGGGKAGNIISPNPNTIAAANNFQVDLSSVMAAGIIPAAAGLIVTFFIARSLVKKGTFVREEELSDHTRDMPGFLAALGGPLVAIILLALRPLAGINIDPLLALPLGGITGCLFMGKIKNLNSYIKTGLGKMTGVAILLIGTGALAGIIANSGLKDLLISVLQASGLPAFVLAPVSGMLMSAATASTTAGTTVASSVFGSAVLGLGVAPVAGAAMIHSGATVLDHLPHGSFFHATGGSVYLNIKERLKVVPFESLVGLAMTLVSSLIYGVFA